MHTTLSHWLRLLWDRAPPLHFGDEAPRIVSGTIHLPASSEWAAQAAAAAHAAAHLVYSPPLFDGSGLGAIARALVGLLEDARVEALAVRELPGLARLWRPLHVATPEVGNDFEALMQRLSRALADPDYDDPDPWVRKGRGLCCLDATMGLAALRTPVEMRQAALRLGHDVGQMRLPFNARTYRPAPAYRDDHRWMWSAETLADAPPAGTAGDGSRRDEELPPDADTSARYPEWDRLIGRARTDWCRVREQVPRAAVEQTALASATMTIAASLAPGLREPLRALSGPPRAARRSEAGEQFDPEALVAWRVARRLGTPADARVYRGDKERATRAAVWLLIDRSASTADRLAQGPSTVLQAAVQAAAGAALALRSLAIDCAVSAFASYGRHDVRMQLVKRFDETPGDADLVARLLALHSGGSTRLGAALRHVTSRLLESRPGPHWIIVLSDGEPHDIDVHDGRYLVEDAARAVHSAGKVGVRIACLALDTHRTADGLRIFGRHRVQALPDVRRLGRVIGRVLA